MDNVAISVSLKVVQEKSWSDKVQLCVVEERRVASLIEEDFQPMLEEMTGAALGNAIGELVEIVVAAKKREKEDA